MNIGERIKQRRLQLGMNAETLAARIGKAPATVYRYENGEINKVDSTIIPKIAQALGVEPGYLMGWEDTSDPDDDDLWTLREDMRRDPNRRALMQLARNGTAQDVRQAMALIDALRATNSEFYDGDDPA